MTMHWCIGSWDGWFDNLKFPLRVRFMLLHNKSNNPSLFPFILGSPSPPLHPPPLSLIPYPNFHYPDWCPLYIIDDTLYYLNLLHFTTGHHWFSQFTFHAFQLHCSFASYCPVSLIYSFLVTVVYSVTEQLLYYYTTSWFTGGSCFTVISPHTVQFHWLTRF